MNKLPKAIKEGGLYRLNGRQVHVSTILERNNIRAFENWPVKSSRDPYALANVQRVWCCPGEAPVLTVRLKDLGVCI